MFKHTKFNTIQDIPLAIREKVNVSQYYGREDYTQIRQEIKTYLQSLGFMPDVASNIAHLYGYEEVIEETE